MDIKQYVSYVFSKYPMDITYDIQHVIIKLAV